jgi:para-aminobenzoate synthetase component I
VRRPARFPSDRPARPVPNAAGEAGEAWFDGLHARAVVEVSDDPAALDAGGWWAVVITFEGRCRFWRFEHVDAAPLPGSAPGRATTGQQEAAAGGRPVAGDRWRSSLDRQEYEAGVARIRQLIRDGEVYQVNLCRILRTPWPPAGPPEAPAGQERARGRWTGPGERGAGEPYGPWALARRLAAGNPAPYAGVIDVPALGGLPATRLVSASPELYLDRDGDRLRSSPIKGTGARREDLLPKDEAENVMIVDLVRNDLQRVSRAGSVAVPDLLTLEQHPGLVHLVSTVEGRLRPGVGWADVVAATFPPGSVSGAPKSSALRIIDELEPVPRGPYCGAVGYVDADRRRARLAVGIRTFWWDDGCLCFGTGAGITWGSDPAREWAETELKAARLIGLAAFERPGTLR